MPQDLDNMLEALKRDSIDTGQLRHLESDVWQRITARKVRVTAPWFEQLLAIIFVPQYRLAPIAMAAVIGVILGSTVLPSPKEASAADMLNFEVFSSQSEYLVSSNLLRN